MITGLTPLTPNIKRLVLEFASKTTVDRVKRPGMMGFDLTSAIAADMASNMGRTLGADLKAAIDQTNAAIEAVRQAADPNPYRNASDEEIAAAIVERLPVRRCSLVQKLK